MTNPSVLILRITAAILIILVIAVTALAIRLGAGVFGGLAVIGRTGAKIH